jgi:hypothetical protein
MIGLVLKPMLDLIDGALLRIGRRDLTHCGGSRRIDAVLKPGLMIEID